MKEKEENPIKDIKIMEKLAKEKGLYSPYGQFTMGPELWKFFSSTRKPKY